MTTIPRRPPAPVGQQAPPAHAAHAPHAGAPRRVRVPYPPYNIARTAENAYRISVAVAGFTDADLSIEAKENTLTIHGEKQNEEETGNVLYQGIAGRNFERSFQLADYVQVEGASLENGLLHVDLVREIPEAMRPRAIPITNSSKLLEVKPTKAAA